MRSTFLQQPSTISQDERDALTQALFADLEHARGRRAQEIRERIAELNIGLVHSLARRYRGRGESDDDLRQAGCIGLMKAVNGFSPDRGTDFVRYAVPTITGEIKKYFRDCCWTIRPTRKIQELHGSVTSLNQTLGHELQRAPTVRELADSLDEDEKTVAEAMSAHHYYSPRSLDAPIEPELEPSLSEVLGGDDGGFSRAEVHVMLSEALRTLGDREKELLRLRFFEDMTQREIAARTGVTQMQVSRQLAQIFRRIRGVMEPDPGTAKPSSAA
jgi:RNA polymerase sigma-B factor